MKLDGEPLPAEPLDVPAAALDGRVLQLGKRQFRARARHLSGAGLRSGAAAATLPRRGGDERSGRAGDCLRRRVR